MSSRRSTRRSLSKDWLSLSQRLRFEITGPHGAGCCWQCGRPHGRELQTLPDGRWLHPDRKVWLDAAGREAFWPDIVEACLVRNTRVVLAACRLETADPRYHSFTVGLDDTLAGLAVLCQRCHILSRQYRGRTRLAVLSRRAMGDLFSGLYRR